MLEFRAMPLLPMKFQSHYRRDKQKYEAEIAAIELAYAPRLKACKGDQLEAELGAMHAEIQWAEIGLEELETEQVEKLAKKWNVVIDSSLYETNFNNRRVLEKESRAKALLLVRNARREEIKWWMSVIIPIVGTITGLIGTTIGLLAYLRRSAP